MRLKSIKLAGFKSFVDPTRVPFPYALTAIVGPNGCGKSNIIDAVRWVLGEGSAKNLRGDAMTDVIFNGSLERKPISQASVELVFDNESGRVGGEFANYNEIAVKRLVSRDGQSKYFLNGNKCRRRDITDIFLGTGLGPRSYAIIEQGMISRLIESKPQELRIFIEEAAGISKYKERRRETENRLKHSRENLDRLSDVREELGQQLNKLQRQSSAAQRYKALKDEERTLKGQLAAIRWLDWQNQHDRLAEQVETLKLQIETLEAQREKSQADQAEQQVILEQSTRAHDDARQSLFQISNQITRLEQQILHQSQHQQRVQQELSRLQHEQSEQAIYIAEQDESVMLFIEELELLREQEAEAGMALEESTESLLRQEQALQGWQQDFQQGSDSLSGLKQQLASAQHQQQLIVQQQNLVSQQQEKLRLRLQESQQNDLEAEQKSLEQELEIQQEELAELELAMAEQQEQLSAQQQKLAKLQEQEQSKQQAIASAKGQSQTLQQWLCKDELDLPALGLDEAKPLSEQLQIEPGWEEVTELVLGQLSRALCVNSQAKLELEQLPPGKALLFNSEQDLQARPGTLASLVHGHTGIQARLNHVLLAGSEQELLQKQAELAEHETLVLKRGIWAGKDWLCKADKTQGELAIRAELQKLEQQLNTFELELAELLTSRQGQQQSCETLQAQLTADELKLRQIQSEQTQKRSELKHLKEKLSLQQQQQQMLLQELEESLLKAEELEQELMMAEESLYLLQEQVEELALEHEAHQAERERIEAALTQARQLRDQQQQQQHQLNLKMTSLQNQLEAARQALTRAQAQQQQSQRRCLELEQELEIEIDDEALRESLEVQLELKIEAEQECTLLSEQMQQAQQSVIDLKHQEQQIINEQGQLKQQLDGLALDQQTARVRAESATESLQEMEQPLKEVLDHLPEEYSEQAWLERLETIGRSVARLGPINLAAIDEYEQCSERKAYLDQQNDDLVQALDTLENAIRRIDRECRARFKETYDKVNADLKMLFPKVFGGGMAYLELTGDDMLETGVTIMARPPGKRNATIHLLSGGEKALTALSLVFAIFRLNPAPFCMLDEVDAPLDDANVGRFCNLVREMAETVQFIYISHNKITMEMADQLAGVTMHEPGVSRLVAVDVDEAVALADL